jgi:enoyl-CoA hydratase/carnithine racemase
MLIGKTRSMELVMTGEQITAERALSMGLVNQIGPDEEVLTAAMGLARRLACKSSASLTSIKKAVQRGHGLPLGDGLKVEADCFMEAYLSQDFHEGINAFLDKRPSRFH